MATAMLLPGLLVSATNFELEFRQEREKTPIACEMIFEAFEMETLVYDTLLRCFVMFFYQHLQRANFTCDPTDISTL